MKLRTALLFVKDLPAMTRFYRDVLGLRHLPERAAPGWEEFDAGGAVFALHAIPPEFARDIVISEPPEARSETPIKLVFAAPDVATERQRLLAAGVPMGELRSWGTCDGVDPEGNVFQIAGA